MYIELFVLPDLSFELGGIWGVLRGRKGRLRRGECRQAKTWRFLCTFGLLRFRAQGP